MCSFDCSSYMQVPITTNNDAHSRYVSPFLEKNYAGFGASCLRLAPRTHRCRLPLPADLGTSRKSLHSALYYPFLGVREGHHSASHNNNSDDYERIARFHLGQLAYLAARLDSMPEGNGTVLDNSCLMWLSNMWIGRKHDNTRLPLVLAGGLGGTLRTGRTLDYIEAGDENRKMCSLYLSIMDRMGVKLDRFGDAETRLQRL